MDLIWLEILIAMIGEQFGDDMDLICGLVCNVRGKGSKISMWTKDWSAEEGNMRIGQVLKQKLLGAEVPPGCTTPLFDWLKYEDHDSCQKKSGSTVKPHSEFCHRANFAARGKNGTRPSLSPLAGRARGELAAAKYYPIFRKGSAIEQSASEQIFERQFVTIFPAKSTKSLNWIALLT
ncbi:hypothetical protein Y032_0002g863 [Ancylostoma ceylanicum]|nr:hypothetical protein Y032_0002g863 [Ancylostoma ceylanicum]